MLISILKSPNMNSVVDNRSVNYSQIFTNKQTKESINKNRNKSNQQVGGIPVM